MAAKAALMYLTAVVVLRVAERRAVVQWTIIDFATAVAMGAIIGRTAIAQNQSYAVGALALLTIVALHRLASLPRFNPPFGKLLDHRIRVLVVDGEVRHSSCGVAASPTRTCSATSASGGSSHSRP